MVAETWQPFGYAHSALGLNFVSLAGVPKDDSVTANLVFRALTWIVNVFAKPVSLSFASEFLSGRSCQPRLQL